MTEQTINNFTFRGQHIPEHMIDGVLEYFNNHAPPGGFLGAILENKFMEACVCADEKNLEALSAWAAFLYNEAPTHAYGTPEKVAAWLEAGEKKGEPDAE